MGNESFSEKVSVNINSGTLSSVDLLVDNGYYSNRSDFINQALREALQRQQTTLDRIIDRNLKEQGENSWFVGVYGLERRELEEAGNQGKTRTLTGYGVLVIDKEIDEALLFRVVTRIAVKGKVICSQTVKDHYGLK